MLYTTEHLPDDVDVGKLLSVYAVTAANVVKDICENIRNLVGGEMKHYETLMEKTVARAFDKLKQKAKTHGYDGVLSVKIATPKVVEGGVEIIVYGNGFRANGDHVPPERSAGER